MLTALKRLDHNKDNVSLRDYTRLAADLLALYKSNTTTATKQGFSIEGLIKVKGCFKGERVKG